MELVVIDRIAAVCSGSDGQEGLAETGSSSQGIIEAWPQ